MATDYDAPRKTDDDSESIEALKERVPDKLSGAVGDEDADNPSGFELPGADLSDLELDVVVLPPQEDEFTCVDKIWTQESNWQWNAENPTSGAYGIPQSLPASKLATAGDDWKTNPATQIKWGLKYIKERYGTPCAAWLARPPAWMARPTG